MKVLALQLKRIGDLVLTAPALLAMKAAGARVTLAVNDGTAALLPALQGLSVDEALTYETRRRGNRPLWQRLASGGFDACVDFTGRDRSALMTLVSHAPHRIIARTALRRGGWRRLVFNQTVDSSLRLRHTVDYYLDHLGALPLPSAATSAEVGVLPTLCPPAESVWRADTDLVSAGIGQDEPYVVVHPGSARSEKYWMPERWAEVIRFVSHDMGKRCVLTGGSGDPYEDAHLTAIRAALSPRDTRILADLAGRLDILTLTALLERAALVLSVDTGPMHIAAAFRRPQIALFGPTNPFHWRPRHADAFVLASSQRNTPMREFNPESPGGPMEAISTQAVIDCIRQMPL